MKKRFAIWDKTKKKFIEFFEYPIQAQKYLDKKLMSSMRYSIVDKKKKR